MRTMRGKYFKEMTTDDHEEKYSRVLTFMTTYTPLMAIKRNKAKAMIDKLFEFNLKILFSS